MKYLLLLAMLLASACIDNKANCTHFGMVVEVGTCPYRQGCRVKVIAPDKKLLSVTTYDPLVLGDGIRQCVYENTGYTRYEVE